MRLAEVDDRDEVSKMMILLFVFCPPLSPISLLPELPQIEWLSVLLLIALSYAVHLSFALYLTRRRRDFRGRNNAKAVILVLD